MRVYRRQKGETNWTTIGQFYTRGDAFQWLDFAYDQTNSHLYLYGPFDSIVNGTEPTPTKPATFSGNYNIAKWDGSNWETLSNTSLNSRPLAIACGKSGQLYVGAGSSIPIDLTSSPPVTASIAQWDQTGQKWQPLGNGLRQQVFAIKVDQLGAIYAGGEITRSGSKTINHVAKFVPSDVATQSTIPADELTKLKLDIAKCREGLKLLEDNAYVYSGPIDDWRNAINTFKSTYLLNCQNIGTFLTNHAGSPALSAIETAIQADGVSDWDGYWNGKTGIVFLGNLIMSHCPGLHRSRFDCIRGPQQLTKTIELVKAKLDLLDALN